MYVVSYFDSFMEPLLEIETTSTLFEIVKARIMDLLKSARTSSTW